MAKKNKTNANAESKIFCALEEIVTNNTTYSYNNIPSDWKNKDITSFANGMNLYNPEQTKALENIASALYLTFNGITDDKPNLALLQAEYDKYIVPAITYQLNRACFWMATGSGKTLVLIKTIEYIDYLMTAGLIPKKEIMLLLPTGNLVTQIQEQISKYNVGRERQIKAINLLDCENDKYSNSLNFGNEIKVYHYRSDLMKDERKTTEINYKTYLNGGNWYLFLDEAHRGDSDYSNLKDYVKKLTENGFLFNFSATFIDPIDIFTTCYNFNLEKFLTVGYGKNIYLSESVFTKQKESNQFTEEQMQKEVLKSFIIYTLIKKSKKTGSYHNPLMITLVNSVNPKKSTPDSDLKKFCEIMFKIANNTVSTNSFINAIRELEKEFNSQKDYVFKKEQISIPSADISAITINDIIKEAFNATSSGNIEFYDCGNGEVVFKLVTAPEPFALIRIGDTATFIKNYLNDYGKMDSYTAKNWFAKLDEPASTINILLGSRTFYEGWDSNRPNVINFINIGSGDAKKYVPQSIGRGVRIQPDTANPNERKRLSPVAPKITPIDPNKNKLLETLFVFATDNNSVDKILTAMTEMSGTSVNNQSLYSKQPALFSPSPNTFDLLIPAYKKSATKSVIASAQFEIESGCQSKFENILDLMPPAVFLLQSHKSFTDTWSLKQYKELKDVIAKKSIFTNIISKNYQNYNFLVSDLRRHICTEEREIDKIRVVNNTPSNEDIVHFKHITTILNSAEEGNLMRFMKMKGPFPILFGHSNGNVNIYNLTEHYYIPLLYADTDKVSYINHIIKIESEIIFVKNLIAFLNKEKAFLDAKETKEKDYSARGEIVSDWMFSKIDETLDKNMGMPYFEDNTYKSFFPDFIFWIKKDNSYKIVFVDPKGLEYTDYQKKIDGFEKLFLNGTTPKIFSYNDYSITFELKLVYTGAKVPTGKYANYWIPQGDFSFLV